MEDELTSRIRDHFAQYASTLSLVDSLIEAKTHAQEVLILVCARLDALANSAGTEDEPQYKKFARFVTNYGGRADFFRSVSLGDLFYEIGYHRWLAPGLLPVPGRLHMFSDLNREVAMLLDDSGIELTESGADRLLSNIQSCLARHFRVRAKQRHKKQLRASTSTIVSTLVKNMRKTPRSILQNIPSAIKPLLLSKTGAAILYRRFRSEAIHGGKVMLDERRFFTEREPYWKPLYSEFYGSFLFLEFPARFLRVLLENCIQTYEKHILTKRAIPPDIHFDLFPDDILTHLDWLDHDLLPIGSDIHLNIPRR
jgi:hypothetical protein